jgi:hypothetical protein
MPRRDAFSGLRDPMPVADVEKDKQQNIAISPEPKLPDQPLDLIPTADFRKKRSRKWENAYRSETVTYRGIPRHAVEWIVEISQSLSVPRDEVVRAFLEYGVALYRSGQLALFVYPKAQRMTLFPENENTSRILPSIATETHSWLKDAFPVPAKKAGGAKKKKDKKNQAEIPHWDMRVTYRIPVLLKEEIRSIAEEHTLPVGEVVWFFIEQGSKAFHDGLLPLQPSPKMIGKTLFQE